MENEPNIDQEIIGKVIRRFNMAKEAIDCLGELLQFLLARIQEKDQTIKDLKAENELLGKKVQEVSKSG